MRNAHFSSRDFTAFQAKHLFRLLNGSGTISNTRQEPQHKYNVVFVFTSANHHYLRALTIQDFGVALTENGSSMLSLAIVPGGSEII